MGTTFNHNKRTIILLMVVSFLLSVTAVVASAQGSSMMNESSMNSSSMINGSSMNGSNMMSESSMNSSSMINESSMREP